LVPKHAEHRRTAYDLLLVEYAEELVSVDARLPNRLFAEAVTDGTLEPFRGTTSVKAEVRRGESRLDFCLITPTGTCWVETKSVTLVENSVALFPDAPTLRGQRHLGELIDLVDEGFRAAVVFIIQRQDATSFAPNKAADPAFAHMLDEAVSSGVEVYGFRCAVSRQSIATIGAVPLCT
jgi:sugar fermentation stimulation protein A